MSALLAIFNMSLVLFIIVHLLSCVFTIRYQTWCTCYTTHWELITGRTVVVVAVVAVVVVVVAVAAAGLLKVPSIQSEFPSLSSAFKSTDSFGPAHPTPLSDPKPALPACRTCYHFKAMTWKGFSFQMSWGMPR